MNWKKQLAALENNKKWNQAIDFLQKIIADNPDDMDAYLSMNYLLMNLLVEEDYDETKHDYYAGLTKRYFDESYAKFSNNPEYLFFTAITACMSDWYFGIEGEDIDKMLSKAIDLDPKNILYKWGAFFSLDKSDSKIKNQMYSLAKNILSEHSSIKELLKEKGSVGNCVLGILTYEASHAI